MIVLTVTGVMLAIGVWMLTAIWFGTHMARILGERFGEAGEIVAIVMAVCLFMGVAGGALASIFANVAFP